jgi:hypothetical protein
VNKSASARASSTAARAAVDRRSILSCPSANIQETFAAAAGCKTDRIEGSLDGPDGVEVAAFGSGESCPFAKKTVAGELNIGAPTAG